MTKNRRTGRPWIRSMTERQLHGLALKLLRLMHTEGLSEKQEWLYDQIMMDLAWRQRRRPPQDRCTCQLCFEVFGIDEDGFVTYWSPWGPTTGSDEPYGPEPF